MFKTLFLSTLTLTLVACSNPNSNNQAQDGETSSQNTEETTDSIGYRFTENTEVLEEAEAVEDKIRNDFEAGEYTAENPMLVLDPYGVAPLSALLVFETESPSTVAYSVEGKTEDTTLSHEIEEAKTIHEIPVLGLYPGYTNQVTLQVTDEGGQVTESIIEVETEELPEAFYEFELVEAQPERMHPGLTFLNSSGGEYTAVDHAGDVRFALRPWMANNVAHLENGNIVIVLRRESNEQESLGIDYDHIVEMDLLGKPHHSYLFDMDNNDNTVMFDHDIIELDNGNILGLVHDSQSEYVEDNMIEFDMETGEIHKVTDFKDIFPNDYYEDYEYNGNPSLDWMHHNAVWQTEDGNSVLISARNHDMVFKISYPDNEIEWIAVIDDNWEDTTRPPEDYMLEPIGDVKFQMAQHAVEEMPDQDGNPDTMDIMLFDNNRMIKRGHPEEAENYSRAVQYRIDEVNNTIEEIWSYGEERGEYSYTDIVSDADYLQDSHTVLVNFGRTYDENDNPSAHVVEVDKDSNEVVFEYHVKQPDQSDRRQIYRAERLPLYHPNFKAPSIINQ